MLHLPGEVLALTRAHRHGGAPLLKSIPMEKIHLCHAVFLHHQSVQAPTAQAVMARLDWCLTAGYLFFLPMHLFTYLTFESKFTSGMKLVDLVMPKEQSSMGLQNVEKVD